MNEEALFGFFKPREPCGASSGDSAAADADCAGTLAAQTIIVPAMVSPTRTRAFASLLPSLPAMNSCRGSESHLARDSHRAQS